jgi:CRISPR-associated protein Cas2
MSNRNLHLTAYDIRQPTRLRRVLNIIKDYATGGQKSAYECYLTPAEKVEMIGRVMHTMNLSEDRFSCIELRQSKQVRTLGKAIQSQNLDYFYIG